LRNSTHYYKFILIDSLDEGGRLENDLERLLRKLAAIPGWRLNKLLLINRNVYAIEQSIMVYFHDLKATSVSLEAEIVGPDIEEYIYDRISIEQLFDTWSDALKIEVQQALISNSNNMYISINSAIYFLWLVKSTRFRWAA